jgi:hypothetical protein
MNSKLLPIALSWLAITVFVRSAEAQNTSDCDDTQKGVISAAQYYTGMQLLGAGDYIGTMKSGGDSTRFEYYFGSTDSAIVDRVEQTLYGVWQGIDDVTYNCSCTEIDANAYVRPNDPKFQIFVCPPYFGAFAAGDMQMTTLIHEISHFLGTRDCTKPLSNGACCSDVDQPAGCTGPDPVTGNSPAAAHRLAMNDPDTASHNAYNIALFVTEP